MCQRNLCADEIEIHIKAIVCLVVFLQNGLGQKIIEKEFINNSNFGTIEKLYKRFIWDFLSKKIGTNFILDSNIFFSFIR